jgi:hypothetical protein
MANFIPQQIVIRAIPERGIVVTQSGDQADVNGQPAFVTTAQTIRDNKAHYLRGMMPRIESGEIAALVHWTINDKPGHILITAEQWAIGAPERARYAAWLASLTGAKAERQAKERAYDLVNNEGGEGYNPHRAGSERTYARTSRGGREFPEGA